MLSAADRLDPPPQRILVAGVAGSGKTTLARRISDATGIPHTEIDALRHGPYWVPRDTLAADVERFTRAASWITEWQYRELRPLA